MNEKEERELIRSVERGEWEPAADADQLKKEFVQAARNTIKKDARMNIRISQNDITALKTKAMEEGLPYQTLVASILHKYITGRLIESPH